MCEQVPHNLLVVGNARRPEPMARVPATSHQARTSLPSGPSTRWSSQNSTSSFNIGYAVFRRNSEGRRRMRSVPRDAALATGCYPGSSMCHFEQPPIGLLVE